MVKTGKIYEDSPELDISYAAWMCLRGRPMFAPEYIEAMRSAVNEAERRNLVGRKYEKWPASPLVMSNGF